MTPVEPGDLVVVDAGKSFLMRWIQRGSRSEFSHVLVAHHIDDQGTFWGLEGRPGGVGWVRLDVYAGRGLSNAGQAKSAEQRRVVCEQAVALLGTPYDWRAYGPITVNELTLLWRRDRYGPQWRKGQAPEVVVCSSFVDYLYELVGLRSPEADRWCTPADWARLWQRHDWARAF